jgi:hypothetical protein
MPAGADRRAAAVLVEETHRSISNWLIPKGFLISFSQVYYLYA